jgi:hypothetical protein
MVILNHGQLVKDGLSAEMLGDESLLLENGLA